MDPQVLTDAARSVDAERRAVEQAADALGPVVDGVVTALPGARTAAVADETGGALVAAIRSLAAELAILAGALGAAGKQYVAVERDAADGLERAGRRPA